MQLLSLAHTAYQAVDNQVDNITRNVVGGLSNLTDTFVGGLSNLTDTFVDGAVKLRLMEATVENIIKLSSSFAVREGSMSRPAYVNYYLCTHPHDSGCGAVRAPCCHGRVLQLARD